MVCVPKIAEKKKNLFAALHFLLLIVLSICHVVFYSTAIFSNVICPGNSGVQVTNIVLCGGTSHPNCLFQNLCGCDSEVQVNLTTANTANKCSCGSEVQVSLTAVQIMVMIFFLYSCIVLLGLLPWEIQVAFPGQSQLQQSCTTQPAVHAGCFSIFLIH